MEKRAEGPGADLHHAPADGVFVYEGYKQFRTNLEAAVSVKNEKVRQLEHGRITSGLDGVVVSTWRRLDEDLASLRTSLAEVGREAVKRHTNGMTMAGG